VAFPAGESLFAVDVSGIDPSKAGHVGVECDDGATLSQVMLKGAAAGDVVMWELSAALISGEACHSKEACHSRGATPMFFVVQIDGISVCGPEYPPAFNTQATRYEWQFHVPKDYNASRSNGLTMSIQVFSDSIEQDPLSKIAFGALRVVKHLSKVPFEHLNVYEPPNINGLNNTPNYYTPKEKSVRNTHLLGSYFQSDLIFDGHAVYVQFVEQQASARSEVGSSSVKIAYLFYSQGLWIVTDACSWDNLPNSPVLVTWGTPNSISGTWRELTPYRSPTVVGDNVDVSWQFNKQIPLQLFLRSIVHYAPDELPANSNECADWYPQCVSSSIQLNCLGSHNGSYVRVNSSSSFDFWRKSFSWAFWVKRENQSKAKFEYVIAQDSHQDRFDMSSDKELRVGFTDTNNFTFAFGKSNNFSLETASNTVDTEEWVHWAGSYEVPTRKRMVYRNGIVVASDSPPSHYLGSGNLIIGRARPPNKGNVTCSGPCPCTPSTETISGTISDGAADYIDNIDCQWLIASEYEISLSFTSFSTEHKHDWVTIYRCSTPSCSSDSREEIARLSGSNENSSNTYTSSTGYLQVVFTSDSPGLRDQGVYSWSSPLMAPENASRGLNCSHFDPCSNGSFCNFDYTVAMADAAMGNVKALYNNPIAIPLLPRLRDGTFFNSMDTDHNRCISLEEVWNATHQTDDANTIFAYLAGLTADDGSCTNNSISMPDVDAYLKTSNPRHAHTDIGAFLEFTNPHGVCRPCNACRDCFACGLSIDGAQACNKSCKYVELSGFTADWRVSQDAPPSCFQGHLDDVMILSRALKSAEIQFLFQRHSLADITSLVLRFSFNEGAADGTSVVRDLSGRGNHGILVNTHAQADSARVFDDTFPGRVLCGACPCRSVSSISVLQSFPALEQHSVISHAGHGVAVDVEHLTVALPDGATLDLIVFANYYNAQEEESASDTSSSIVATPADARTDNNSNNSGLISSSRSVGYQTESQVIMYDAVDAQFKLLQTLSTKGAVDLESFHMAAFMWLGIANSFDGSYETLDSVLYRWHPAAASFVEHQRFNAHGARQFKFLGCGAGKNFLALSQSTSSRNATDIYHWRWHLFPDDPPAAAAAASTSVPPSSPSPFSSERVKAKAMLEEEEALQGYSWVHVQSIVTEAPALLEGGLLGSTCKLIVSGSCDSCSQVWELVDTAPFVNEEWEQHFTIVQALPLSGVSAISLFHRGSFAYVSFTLQTPTGEDGSINSSSSDETEGGGGGGGGDALGSGGGGLVVYRFHPDADLLVASFEMLGVPAHFKTEYVSIAGENMLIIPSVSDTSVCHLASARLAGSSNWVVPSRGIADFTSSSMDFYSDFSSFALRNMSTASSLVDKSAGWQVSAVKMTAALSHEDSLDELQLRTARSRQLSSVSFNESL
jgi:hypothetical protein